MMRSTALREFQREEERRILAFTIEYYVIFFSFFRKSVLVFCSVISDPELGSRVTWTLEKGSPIPLCVDGGG